jgi:hypothetical protein
MSLMGRPGRAACREQLQIVVRQDEGIIAGQTECIDVTAAVVAAIELHDQWVPATCCWLAGKQHCAVQLPSIHAMPRDHAALAQTILTQVRVEVRERAPLVVAKRQ